LKSSIIRVSNEVFVVDSSIGLVAGGQYLEGMTAGAREYHFLAICVVFSIIKDIDFAG
jgi:hypothetical protein